MRHRSLGPDLSVGAVGLGCMGMSGPYGPADHDESIATIHAALDAGVTLLDTGDYYGMGDNEMLIREALRERRREDVVLSVKFGALRDPRGAWLGFDARPAAVRDVHCLYTPRLGTDYVDIYRPGRVDPAVPIEETVGAIADLIAEGYVRHVGLSEAGADTIRRAHAVHPVADLQIEYSLISRGIEDRILPTCRELGVGITAYGVLSRGLMSGHWTKDRAATPGDFRAYSPALQGREPRAQPGPRGGAPLGGRRPWRHRGAGSPSPGCSRGARTSCPWWARAGAIAWRKRWAPSSWSSGPDDLAAIEAAVPPGSAAGERYGPDAMSRWTASGRERRPKREGRCREQGRGHRGAEDDEPGPDHLAPAVPGPSRGPRMRRDLCGSEARRGPGRGSTPALGQRHLDRRPRLLQHERPAGRDHRRRAVPPASWVVHGGLCPGRVGWRRVVPGETHGRGPLQRRGVPGPGGQRRGRLHHQERGSGGGDPGYPGPPRRPRPGVRWILATSGARGSAWISTRRRGWPTRSRSAG